MPGTQNELENLKNLKIEAKKTSERNNTDSVLEFPIEVFPQKLQDIMENVTDAMGINSSFLGSTLLFAYSLGIGKSHKVQFKKHQFQKAVLYLSLVSRPTSNKSSAIEFAMKPFSDKEELLNIKYEKELMEYKEWLEKPKEEKSENFKEEPRPEEFYLNDSTMENTWFSMKTNKRGLAIWRDEIAGFLKDLERYNKNGNKEHILSNWSGVTVKIGRVTKPRIYIPDPFLNIAGTTQPNVFLELAREFLKEGAGLIDRFLFVFPDKQPKPEYTDNEVSEDLVKEYKASINRILGLEIKTDESNEIQSSIVGFQKAAKDKLRYWLNEVNKPRCDLSQDTMAGIYGKYDIHIQRICLILHFIKWTFGESEGKEMINLDTVEKSIKIVDFFISHAEKIQRLVNNVDPASSLSDHELKLYNDLPEVFAVKDVLNISQKFGKKEKALYNYLNAFPELFQKQKQGSWKKI